MHLTPSLSATLTAARAQARTARAVAHLVFRGGLPAPVHNCTRTGTARAGTCFGAHPGAVVHGCRSESGDHRCRRKRDDDDGRDHRDHPR